MKAKKQSDNLIKLAHPTIPESAIQRAVEVLRSGALVQGQWVRELETALCRYLGVNHAVVVSSGTAALHVALLAANIGPGDEVIVPAFTFPATANAVVLTGARPLVIDISLDDFNLDPSLAEAAITERTRAIMPVHEFGLPSDLTAIREIANRNNLIVIEDAACALGAEFEGRKVGSNGNLTCFSLHPRKAITTGEGGVVVTDSEPTAERLRSLRNHGITNRDGHMDIGEASLNYRMTDFQAALALDQVANLDSQISHRRTLARTYDELLKDVVAVRVPATFPERGHVYQTYQILVDESVDRDRLIAELRKRGVETNFGAWALNLLTLYQRQFGCSRESCPNAVRAFHSGLALPIGNHVTNKEIAVVARTIAGCLEEITASV